MQDSGSKVRIILRTLMFHNCMIRRNREFKKVHWLLQRKTELCARFRVLLLFHVGDVYKIITSLACKGKNERFTAAGMRCRQNKFKSWGPFLESPENFSGPKSHS